MTTLTLIAMALLPAIHVIPDTLLVRAAHEPPPFMLGEFVDDYGVRYTVSAELWVQRPDAVYHVREWHTDERFFIAQNDAGNASEAGLWTRVDWVTLDGSDGFEWAFCYAEYRASTPREAIEAPPSRRDAPRVGCNGFPFSRMKRSGSAGS